MLKSVDFLHKNKIAHMDLKIENFLIFEKEGKKVVKLIDFNSFYSSENGIIKHISYGTFLYSPPECNS